jgi:hypothetical protein
LHVKDIDSLVHMGFLTPEQREDADALQWAILGVVYRTMEQEGCLAP